MDLPNIKDLMLMRRWASHRGRGFIVIFFLFLLPLLASESAAQLQPSATYNIETRMNLSEVGDVDVLILMKFPDTSSYHTSKQLFGNNKYLLVRQIAQYLSKYLLEIGDPEYNDANRELKFGLKVRGMAVCKQGQWEVETEEGIKLVSKQENTWIFNFTTQSPAGLFNEHIYFQFPKLASEIVYDDAHNSVKFKLPDKYKRKGGKLEVDTKFRETLMSCVYKVYGDPKLGNYWVAKTIFRNTGKGKIEDLKVKYKIRGYTDWSVPNTYSILAPGGTIVDLYYPQLAPEVAQLTSKTPSTLEIEYSYKGADPKQDGKTIYVRGKNEFEHSDITTREAVSWFDNFANVPLLAAFVTKGDPAVRKFVDMVSRASGGVAASLKDEDAVAWLKALYDLEVANGFSYQTPPGLLESVFVQEVKYPRDVLAGKAGTCIDLAILYASCAEATSIRSFLVVIPGHCFPLFVLPSGNILPVEATAIGRASFEEAFKQAQETFQKAQQDGRIILADIEEIWKLGVSPPELPPVPEDCLEKWGIRIPQAGGPVVTLPQIYNTQPVFPPAPPVIPPAPPITPPAPPSPTGVSGVWVGTAYNTTVGMGAKMEMQLQQTGPQVFGYVTVYPPLEGSCQVQGTIYGNSLYLDAVTPVGNYVLEAIIQGNHMEGSYEISSYYDVQQGVIRADRMY